MAAAAASSSEAPVDDVLPVTVTAQVISFRIGRRAVLFSPSLPGIELVMPTTPAMTLQVGDVMQVYAEIGTEAQDERLVTMPKSMKFIRSSPLYASFGTITLNEEGVGYITTDQLQVVLDGLYCKCGTKPLGRAYSCGFNEMGLRTGDDVEFEAINRLDGVWQAFKIDPLPRNRISHGKDLIEYRPDDGSPSTVVLRGPWLPPFARHLDALIVKGFNNPFLPQYNVMPSSSYGMPSSSYGMPSSSYGMPSRSYGSFARQRSDYEHWRMLTRRR